jgi:hypothetical protein
LQISYLQQVVVFGQAFERNGGSMVGAVNDETREEQRFSTARRAKAQRRQVSLNTEVSKPCANANCLDHGAGEFLKKRNISFENVGGCAQRLMLELIQ